MVGVAIDVADCVGVAVDDGVEVGEAVAVSVGVAVVVAGAGAVADGCAPDAGCPLLGVEAGAGFGGCTVNLVRAEAAEAAAEAIKKGYQEALGLKAEVYICQASDGALAG